LRWLGIILIGAVVLAACARPAAAGDAAADDVSARCLQALQSMAAAPADAAHRTELELFLLGEMLRRAGHPRRAAAYDHHLLDYYPGGVLAAEVPSDLPDVPGLDLFDPDPDFSRLVLYALQRVRDSEPPPNAGEFADWFDLLQAASASPQEILPAADAEDFLRQHPEAPLAGWAAYQLLWRERLAADPEAGADAFQRFWAEHPRHPLGQEAAQALDLVWFSPRSLAQASALLPGMGEEILEPGLRESSSPLFSEALFLLGAVGFAVAAQQGDRSADLTGALVFFNLVLLNHRSSSDYAYVAAFRRNLAERRKFLAGRLSAPITGEGRFGDEFYSPPPLPPLAGEGVLLLLFRQAGAGDALRGRGWVRDDQLANLGLRAEVLFSPWEADLGGGLRLGAGVAPFLRGFSTRARRTADSPLAGDVEIAELGAGAEAGLLLRLDLQGPWLQLRCTLGPGYRHRSLRVDSGGGTYAADGLAACATAALALGGISGTYWQVGVNIDDSFRAGEFEAAGRPLTVPSRGWETQFGLGVRF